MKFAACTYYLMARVFAPYQISNGHYRLPDIVVQRKSDFIWMRKPNINVKIRYQI